MDFHILFDIALRLDSAALFIALMAEEIIAFECKPGLTELTQWLLALRQAQVAIHPREDKALLQDDLERNLGRARNARSIRRGLDPEPRVS